MNDPSTSSSPLLTEAIISDLESRKRELMNALNDFVKAKQSQKIELGIVIAKQELDDVTTQLMRYRQKKLLVTVE
jgi:hypothetical protein